VGICRTRIHIKEYIKLMAAAEYNITISQNADYVRTFQLKSAGNIVNITGYSFEAKVKKNYNESSGKSFTTAIENATSGLFTITLTDVETGTLSPGDQVYDVVMTDDSGIKTRLLQGKAYISPGVS
jgi:hypothetical protein